MTPLYYAALAKSEQEPVGWFESPHGAFRANPLYKLEFPSQLLAWSLPLYTHPPQRKPLTDEQINAIAEDGMNGDGTGKSEAVISRTRQGYC